MKKNQRTDMRERNRGGIRGEKSFESGRKEPLRSESRALRGGVSKKTLADKNPESNSGKRKTGRKEPGNRDVS